MSTEKKNEKWKTYSKEREKSGVQSFSHDMEASRVGGALHGHKANTFNAEDTEKTRKKDASFLFSAPLWRITRRLSRLVRPRARPSGRTRVLRRPAPAWS